jgi:tRNA (cmo5U34)-methyltransferase
MQRRDHHDWASEAYVEEWVRRKQAEDPSRAERWQLMCDLLPFSPDATVTMLDVGAGYGPLSRFILDRDPHATCIAHDGSEPMLNRARSLSAPYGERLRTHLSDLFAVSWLPKEFGPFDAAVSSSCFHNLRDFQRVSEIYREIRTYLKPGGVFLNEDLISAPTAALQQRYDDVAATRRRREGVAAEDLQAKVESRSQSSQYVTTDPCPATLDQQLAAVKAAGFTDVDCFWKDLRRALIGGYA